MKKIKIILMPVLLLLVSTSAAAQVATPLGPPDTRMAAMMAHERTAHVGQTLPHGIEVVNKVGHLVDMRSQLQHGPVIVIKIRKMANCSPCNELFQALQKSHGHSIGEPSAHIVVLQVGDEGHDPLKLPNTVTEMHTASLLKKGFFGGNITPTAFYFDKQLKLISRHPGMTSAQIMLHFPTKH